MKQQIRNAEMERVEVNCGDWPVERLLTAQEVGRALRVSTAWVYDHAYRKRPLLPSIRLGKAVRFRPQDLERFIEEMSRRTA